ncbi:hypothetical protein KR50_07070 [Jeotgalibacillus campisalis]|uniref:Abi family protein n=2 Tax=Jeotgalibacillus campisalis TaxID=220754 RepID=A0A0C2W2G8_9BACL|nr:hypothetical protein KR50_07070 [Jeotgalibacillus campisalis]
MQQKIKEKEKLTADEQIEYLIAKGIKFTSMKEEEAKRYLMENSYYYKVTAYRLNFLKDNDGFYHNLDFAHLTDLATIDMHLRYLVIKLSLDIEHALKSLLVNLITDDPGQDGYQIIEAYNDHIANNLKKRSENGMLPQDYVHVKDKIIKVVRNVRDYNYDFYLKTKDKTSIWKLIEMMSFGQLVSFVKFYVDKSLHKSKKLKKAALLLGYAKNVRDSAAHSRPILLNVTEINQLNGQGSSHKTKQPQAEPELKTFVKQNGLNKKVASRLLTNFKINDLCSLILLHDVYIQSPYMRKARKKEIIKLYRRALYKKNIYKNVKEFDEIIELFFGVIKKYKIK